MSNPRRAIPRVPRDASWLVAIGLTGAAVRLAFAWQYTGQPLGQFPWVDEASYWSWGQAILQGGWWPVRPFYQDPLYPYWLACLMGVVGTNVAALRMASAVVGSVTPLAVFWAGRTGLGRAEALLAAWATALYGPLIFADGSLEKEGLAALCTAVALALTALVSKSSRLALAATAGAAWGVVGLLRSNALLIAPLAAGWLLSGANDQTGQDRNQRSRLALTWLAGFFVVILPVAAVNTAVSNPHELLGTTWQLGPNFYIGNGPGATGTYMAPPFVRAHPAYEAADYAREAMRLTGRPLRLGQVSRFWLGEGLKQWARDPVASLRLFTRKLALLTHRFEIPDSQDIEFVQIVAAPALAWGLVDFGILFPLAVIGLARVPRSRFWWFLSLATLLGLVATAVFFVVGRYRVPWVPGLVLLAAVGAVDLARMLRRGAWGSVLWRLGVLGLPATLLSWRHQPDPVPTRWGNQLIALALADLRADRLDAAIDALDLARASSPETAARIRELSAEGPFHDLLRDVVYRELGKGANRNGVFRETVGQVRLLRQLQERCAQARSLIDASVRSSSTDAPANRELGILLLSWPERRADRDTALKALENAARAPAGDLRATLFLSLATGDRGRLRGLTVSALESRDFLVRLVRAMLVSAEANARISSLPRAPASG